MQNRYGLARRLFLSYADLAEQLGQAMGNGRLTRWMSRLGSRSLGSLLFAYPGFRRGAIEFLRLDCRHPLYQRAAALSAVGCELWARRSLHRLGTQQVLVTEVFLPDIRHLK